MDSPITRAEHEEFRRRMEEEHSRQNKRIGALEEAVDKTQTIAVAVERLATSMENMCKEQERQGKRLEALEGRDGQMWRNVIAYIATAVVGIILGFVFTQLGF